MFSESIQEHFDREVAKYAAGTHQPAGTVADCLGVAYFGIA